MSFTLEQGQKIVLVTFTTLGATLRASVVFEGGHPKNSPVELQGGGTIAQAGNITRVVVSVSYAAAGGDAGFVSVNVTRCAMS